MKDIFINDVINSYRRRDLFFNIDYNLRKLFLYYYYVNFI